MNPQEPILGPMNFRLLGEGILGAMNFRLLGEGAVILFSGILTFDLR